VHLPRSAFLVSSQREHTHACVSFCILPCKHAITATVTHMMMMLGALRRCSAPPSVLPLAAIDEACRKLSLLMWRSHLLVNVRMQLQISLTKVSRCKGMQLDAMLSPQGQRKHGS
jgi:hypothetical protein